MSASPSIRYLTTGEILEIHQRVGRQSGGAIGVRDFSGLESALAQPRMAFAGQDLYPDLVSKAAALGFSLIQNHPFVDGNKRTGHAAMEVFLNLNGCDIQADLGDQERTVLSVASGQLSRADLTEWLRTHLTVL